VARLIADPVAAARAILTPDFIVEDASSPGLPKWRGAYALLIRLDSDLETGFCRAQDRLAVGWYAYVGSAHGPGGVGARIARHLRRDKKPHWHVDRLTLRAGRVVALALADAEECAIALRLRQSTAFAHILPGFGSSDCAVCTSHLLAWNASACLAAQ
jgi:Uri superfamily endonuclease